jgi:hypothetical protein
MLGSGVSEFIDNILSDNARFIAIVLAVLVAHIAILIASIARRRTLRTTFALNLVLASLVILYLVTRIGSHPALIQEIRDGVDGSSVPILAVELAVAVASLLAFRRVRFAVLLSWLAFGLHGLASAAAIAFAMTFKLSALI